MPKYRPRGVSSLTENDQCRQAQIRRGGPRAFSPTRGRLQEVDLMFAEKVLGQPSIGNHDGRPESCLLSAEQILTFLPAI